jgi:probable phosphoglycerate mutase
MTIRLALIRHGPTDWNAQKRLQGRTDTDLSAAGRKEVSRYTVPPELMSYRRVCSPLARAQQTAQLLFQDGGWTTVSELVEISFGDWEGQTLSDLRATLGEEMRVNEARGLDFCAPGGESPRMVQTRLAPVLRQWVAEGQDVLAITHKGVIRALYAWAAGWDMTGKCPDRLRWDVVHLFTVDVDGTPHIQQLNSPLMREDAS